MITGFKTREQKTQGFPNCNAAGGEKMLVEVQFTPLMILHAISGFHWPDSDPEQSSSLLFPRLKLSKMFVFPEYLVRESFDGREIDT